MNKNLIFLDLCIIFKVKNENSTSTFYLEDNMKYVCTLCGYVYDDEVEEIPFKDLPEDWICPLCGASKSEFVPQ